MDLLTPAWSNITTPVFIKRLNATAKPLRYLDYIIEGPKAEAPVQAAIPVPKAP